MRSRLAFFILAFVGIVSFSLTAGRGSDGIDSPSAVLGLQGKLAQNVCQEPSSGCPSGKYWDSFECQCKSESSGSTCQEPSGGCGTNHYWDSNLCTCADLATTTTPSVTPEPDVSSTPASGACSEPLNGCGSNNVFDYDS